ncbi:MAG: C40 family peptidase [Elusimicrobia bacterium]|nr:C40 family peptidase [Elusimicrobiota bacterium]
MRRKIKQKAFGFTFRLIRVGCLALAGLLAVLPLSAAAAQAKSIADARNEVVQETLKYLSIPYLWGGTHPGTGLDCSGFVQLVYSKAGLNLPRVAREQFAASLYLKPAAILPGDMIFFSMKRPGSSKVDHIGIYVGKGFFVHASVSNGIHIDSVSNPYYFQRIVSVRKYRGF